MKHTALNILFVLAVFMSFGQELESPLQKKVSFEVEDATIAETIGIIDSMAEVYFSYNPDLIGAENRLSAKFHNQSIEDILNRVINTDQIGYRTIGNQIILFSLEKIIPKKPVLDYYFTLEGKVSSSKNKSAIPYCNIAIKGMPTGTISNSEGYYRIKIPIYNEKDTLLFSSMGFKMKEIALSEINLNELNIHLEPNLYELKEIDVIHYDPIEVLENVRENFTNNYEQTEALYTAFYREIVQENMQYTEISEAVVEILKAPYQHESRNDKIKFLKGRKSAKVNAYDDYRLRMLGGPFYITKLDIVKTSESFINEEYLEFYKYNFDRTILYNEAPTLVIEFKPFYQVREYFYTGRLFIDKESWAVVRAEFELTRHGLKEAQSMLIKQKPKKIKVSPTELKYVVDYKKIDNKWYLNSAYTLFDMKIKDRKNREKTNFTSSIEMLVTNIEKGDIYKIPRKEQFHPHDFVTEKIVGYDPEFWNQYNTIRPEDELEKAIKNFDRFNLMIKDEAR